MLTLYTIGIKFGNSNDAYTCWRKMLIEDCFCSVTTNELVEREQTKKISFETRVSIEIFLEKINFFYLFPYLKTNKV